MTIPNDDSHRDQPAPDQPGTPTPPTPPTPPAPPAPPAFSAPPTGAPGAFPAYSATPQGPIAAPSGPPTPVNVAFWLYIASAVISVISAILTIVDLGSNRAMILDQLQHNSSLKTNGLSFQQLADATVATVTVISIITMIFWVVVFVLFAVFMRRGANWARIVLTVLTVISLLNIPDGHYVASVQVVAAIVATVLIWLKPASAYFAAVKAAKAPRA